MRVRGSAEARTVLNSASPVAASHLLLHFRVAQAFTLRAAGTLRSDQPLVCAPSSIPTPPCPPLCLQSSSVTHPPSPPFHPRSKQSRMPDPKPTEKQIDDAVAATFPASDPVALHGDATGQSAAGHSAPSPHFGRQGVSPKDDQSLQAGSQRTGESAGSGGEGRSGNFPGADATDRK